jgi:CPA1 family monovalent cation:H+ antiporter
MTPYFAYLPAEAAGVSPVLAAVTAGIWLGWRSPRVISAPTRIQAFAVWEVLTFLLNATLFTLVGLALPTVLDNLHGQSTGELISDAVIVLAAVILLRFLWVFPTSYVPRKLSRRVRERDRQAPWQQLVLTAWMGMRGAVSLAAALAIPTSVPDRDLIIFFTYAVIMGTLVVQGLSLPFVIRALRIGPDGKEAYKESKARMKAAEAAVSRVEELREEEWVRAETADRVRQLYDYRRRRFASRFADDGTESEEFEGRSVDYQRLVHEVLAAQRDAIVELRNAGRITDEIMHRIERDLDLEESRLEI